MSTYFQPYSEPAKESQGYLILHVKNNQGEDISDAKIDIIRRRDNALKKILKTNANGQIKVSLPTPPAGYGIEGKQYFVPYTIYKLRIAHEDKIVFLSKVAIYANLTTIQFCVI